MNIGIDGLAWLFVFAVTLHMIEEVIWLPAWSQSAGNWHEPVDRRTFAFATAVMLLFLYLVAFLAGTAPPETLSIYLLCGLALVMIVNLAIPHLGATITQRRYAPGLGTSLFLVAPLSAVLLWQAFASDLISMPRYLIASLGMLLVAAVIWPALFYAGRRMLD
jgi:hypothetical protein